MSEQIPKREPRREFKISSFQELVRRITESPSKHHQRVIAIDGGGGAGKTTFADCLKKEIADSHIVRIDDFYRPPQLRIAVASTDAINPNFDWDRLRTLVLEAVKSDREIRYQLYDFNKGALSDSVITIPRDAIVIVEGVWSLQEDFIDFYDYRIWLEAPDDVRLERGVARDGEELRQVWEEEWIPIDKHYKETYQPQLQADCVIDSFHSDFSKNKIVANQ